MIFNIALSVTNRRRDASLIKHRERDKKATETHSVQSSGERSEHHHLKYTLHFITPKTLKI